MKYIHCKQYVSFGELIQFNIFSYQKPLNHYGYSEKTQTLFSYIAGQNVLILYVCSGLMLTSLLGPLQITRS